MYFMIIKADEIFCLHAGVAQLEEQPPCKWQVAGSIPVSSSIKIFYLRCNYLKEITVAEMKKLFNAGVIKNTRRGIVDQDGNLTGYKTTRNKRYIEGKYVDIAQSL